MLRRISPYIILLIAVLLDTAMLPVLYYGLYTVPITLAAVLCLSLMLGRVRGMLYGMIGGLLIDITTGTLGVMTFFAMVTAFVIDLLLNETRYNEKILNPWLFHLRHAALFFLLYLAGETVLLVYRYFETAIFEWSQFAIVLARSGIFTVLATLLYMLLRPIVVGKHLTARVERGHRREVKHF